MELIFIIKKPKDLFFYFKNKLNNQRFDAIAYSVQKFTEDLLNKWFLNISSKYGVNNFIFWWCRSKYKSY